MNPYNFALLFFAFNSLTLGCIVLFKRGDQIGFTYFLFSLFASIWGTAISILFSSNTHYDTALLCARIGNAIACFIGPTWLHFSLCYTHRLSRGKFLLGFFYAAAAFISCFTFSPLFIPNLHPFMGFKHYTLPGPVFHMHALLFACAVPVAFFVLIKYTLEAEGLEKTRAKQLIFATLIAFVGGSLTFLPVYQIPLPQFNLFVMPIYPFLMAYVLTTQKLFDIEEIAQAAHRNKLETMGILSASIHHEIKNPLHVMRNLIQALQMRLNDRSDIPEVIAGSQDLSGRLLIQMDKISNIIGRLASFTRRKDYTKLNQTPILLQEVLGDVLLFIQHEFLYENIEVVKDIPENYSIVCDKGCMEEALLNLILNAFHALKGIKEKGREKKIVIRAKIERGAAQIKIEDNGPGMPAHIQQTIFQPFYTTKETGSGLGLYITKQLVEINGGKISLISIPGKGTKFILEFPGVNPEKESAGTVKISIRRAFPPKHLRTP